MTAARPALVAAALLAAFTCGLFFTGYRDVIYAPAVFLLLLAACTAVIPSFWRACRLPAGAAALLLFLFWLYITVSLCWSTVPFTSLVTWLVFICLPATFFSLSAPEDPRTFLVPSVIALLTAMAALGGWAVIQVVFLHDVYGVRAHHPLPNANDLAALLNLGLFPVLGFMLHRKEKSALYYAAGTAALLIFTGLVATQSRSGFLFMLAGLVLLFIAVRPPLKRVLQAGTTGAVLFTLMQLENGGRFAARLAQMADAAADPNVTSRLSLWKSTLRMTAENPWGGTGFGTFYLYYPRYRAPLIENSAGFWAHMDPLQFGAETGIAATILFYALTAAIAFQTFAGLRRTKEHSPERAAISGFSAALLTLFLHAHTSFPLYIMPVLIVAGVWLAVWQNLCAGYKPLSVASWQRPVLALSVSATAAMISLLAASSAAGQYYLLKAANNIKEARVSDFIDNIERAERYAPRSFIDPDVQRADLYIDTIGGAGILFPAEDREAMYREALDLLDRAESMNPAWAEIDYKRGKLHSADGKTAEATASWARALEKNPQHTRARSALARAMVAAGKPAAAYDLLESGFLFPVEKDAAQKFRGMMGKIESIARIQKSFIEGKPLP